MPDTEVSNGWLIARVLARFGDWLWVKPLRHVEADKGPIIDDGPLTWAASDVTEAVHA